MYDNLFCKIFIDADMEYEKLFTMIKDYIRGEKEAISYISTDWSNISVQKNKEYDMNKYLLNPNDFLYWKYYLDMEPKNVDEKIYIREIAGLLSGLREQGICAIAACDFENELKFLK